MSASGGLWYFNYLCDFGLGGGECPSSSPGSSTPGGGAQSPSSTGGGGGQSPSTTGGGTQSPSSGGPPGSVLGYSPASTPAPAPVGAPTPAGAPAPVGAPPPPVNCAGYWQPCSATCGSGTQTYHITTQAANGGTACSNTDGETKPCSGPPCGVNCVGSFTNWGSCSATCGYGTQSRTYNITTQQAGGGASCPHPDGYTETQTCPNLPACVATVDCVGHWGDWTGCSAGCGGGTQTRQYIVDTAASGGGAACPYTNGQTQSQACNTTSCCSAATVGDWYDVGGVICTGSSDPDPYIYQSRAVTFPANPVGSATAQACSITVARTRKTAGPDPTGNKCPDRIPVSGTCSLGNPWSTGGCALPGASSTRTCPSGYTWNGTECIVTCPSTKIMSYQICPTSC